MRAGQLIHIVGLVLLGLAAGMLVSAVVATLFADGSARALLLSAALVGGGGGGAVLGTRLGRDLSIREGYAVVSLCWIAAGLAGALPYLLAGTISDPVAAIFESVSGFTTTGATVLASIETVPHGILFWRALTQWLGGMGIIVLALAILPVLGVGGMQMFRAEVPGVIHERLRPRIAQTAKALWLVYAILTAAQALLLIAGGLSPFDAVTHAFTTLPTGGFSTRDASIAAFDSVFVQYVFILFMYLAGVNFALHFRAIRGRVGAYPRSGEWRLYTWILLGASLLLLLLTLGPELSEPAGLERAFRAALFQTVSITTTTGYVSHDYALWPMGAQVVLLLLMFAGGMAGSTAGGLKTVRIQLLLRQALSELKKNLHPRAVVVTRIGPTPISDDVLLKAIAFILLFFGLFAAGVLAMALLGHDLVTAVGASAASIANIGPGLGGVGPVEHYGWLGWPSQLVLAFLMLVGRLEIFTVLLLFHPDLWRRNGGRRHFVRQDPGRRTWAAGWLSAPRAPSPGPG